MPMSARDGRPKDGMTTKRRIPILKVAPITLMMLGCLAASAQAKLVAKKLPSSIHCGAVPLGVTASKHHKGSRTVRVKVFSGSRVVYRRRVTPSKRWTKALPLPCGQTYVVVYRFPGGRKLTRRVRVRALSSTSPTTTGRGGGRPNADPALTPQEIDEFAAADKEEAKQEAEEEAREDDDDPMPDEPPTDEE